VQRRQFVKEVRAGASARSVARRLGVTLSHVQHWLNRAGSLRLHRVDWTDRAPGPQVAANRTPPPIEQAILRARQSLDASDLGECGARAIHAHLLAQEASRPTAIPCVRTIGRVLQRAGMLDAKIRTRRPPPARGWYLPRLARREAELDSFDAVEGLVIAGGTEVEVLNAMSLHGSLPGSWPGGILHTEEVLACLLAHWRRHGLPAYAQFDNATPFQGPHQYLDTLGRVVRLCLQLGVTPVFAPPRETGFQAAIESYNARWQAKVWQRFIHADLDALRVRSAAYIAACENKSAALIATAQGLRRPFPEDFAFQPKAPLCDTVIFLRRTDETGHLVVMGRLYEVDAHWQHRLVRVEVDFTKQTMNFHGLRRAAPTAQPLLKTRHFQPADKQTKGVRAHRDVATRGRRLDNKSRKP
jgi:transposase-like protein